MMTTDELRRILNNLDWSQGELARRVNRSPRGIRRIAAGDAPIDDALADWLRALDRAWPAFAAILDNPPPNPNRGDRYADSVDTAPRDAMAG